MLWNTAGICYGTISLCYGTNSLCYRHIFFLNVNCSDLKRTDSHCSHCKSETGIDLKEISGCNHNSFNHKLLLLPHLGAM